MEKIKQGLAKAWNFYQDNRESIHTAAGWVKRQVLESEVPLPDPTRREDLQQYKLNKRLLNNQKNIIRDLTEEERMVLEEVKDTGKIVDVTEILRKHDELADSNAQKVTNEIVKLEKDYDTDRDALAKNQKSLFNSLMSLKNRVARIAEAEEQQIQTMNTEMIVENGTSLFKDIVNTIPGVSGILSTLADSGRSVAGVLTGVRGMMTSERIDDMLHDNVHVLPVKISQEVHSHKEQLRKGKKGFCGEDALKVTLSTIKDEMNLLADRYKKLIKHGVTGESIDSELHIHGGGLIAYSVSRTNGEIFCLACFESLNSPNFAVLFIDVELENAGVYQGTTGLGLRIDIAVNRLWREFGLPWNSSSLMTENYHKSLYLRNMDRIGTMESGMNYQHIVSNMTYISRNLHLYMIGTYSDCRRNVLRGLIRTVTVRKNMSTLSVATSSWGN